MPSLNSYEKNKKGIKKYCVNNRDKINSISLKCYNNNKDAYNNNRRLRWLIVSTFKQFRFINMDF